MGLTCGQGHDGPVMSMAVHPSGGLLATGGADKKVLVWDVDGGYCTHYFTGHKGVVSCILFHPDPEKHLVSLKLQYFRVSGRIFCKTGLYILYAAF